MGKQDNLARNLVRQENQGNRHRRRAERKGPMISAENGQHTGRPPEHGESVGLTDARGGPRCHLLRSPRHDKHATWFTTNMLHSF